MTEEQLEPVVRRDPFEPFRLVMDNGEEVLVRKPRKACISGDVIAVVGICRQPNGAGIERFRLLSLDRVVSAENVKNGRLGLR